MRGELPYYQCHKVVQAAKITAITRHLNGSATLVVILPDRYAEIEVDLGYVQKHAPRVGGYYVLYPDGYESYSPAKPFEEGYSQLDEHYVNLVVKQAIDVYNALPADRIGLPQLVLSEEASKELRKLLDEAGPGEVKEVPSHMRLNIAERYPKTLGRLAEGKAVQFTPDEDVSARMMGGLASGVERSTAPRPEGSPKQSLKSALDDVRTLLEGSDEEDDGA